MAQLVLVRLNPKPPMHSLRMHECEQGKEKKICFCLFSFSLLCSQPSLPTPSSRKSPLASNQPMAPSSDSDLPLLQAFETKKGEPHQQLPAQICSETGDWCIFWQDVQNAIPGVDFVWEIWGSGEKRVLFMVGQDGEV